MKRIVRAVALGWIMGHTVPVYAEGNGHDLLTQCTQAALSFSGTADPTTVNYMDAGRCIGQIDGFAGAAAFYESQAGAPGAVCFPDGGITVRQSVPLVIKYLEGHPEQLHESATVLIFGAFLANYSCR